MRSQIKARSKITGQRNFVRCATVSITIFSWLAISNHCAFGAIADRDRETESACPFHSEPVKPEPPPSGTQCCKILRPVVPGETKSVCPFYSEPVKPEPPPSGTQCCKILRAVVPVVTKSWARDDAKVSSVDLRVDEFGLVRHSHTTPAPLFLDTGPPKARTFAELILQGSLLAHAPPVRAYTRIFASQLERHDSGFP